MLVSGCVSTHLIWLVHPTSKTGGLTAGIVPTQHVQTVLTRICACLSGQRDCQTCNECCVLLIKVEVTPQFRHRWVTAVPVLPGQHIRTADCVWCTCSTKASQSYSTPLALIHNHASSPAVTVTWCATEKGSGRHKGG